MPQFDPTMVSVSGLSGTPNYMPDSGDDDAATRERKLKALRGITGQPGSIAMMPTDGMSGMNIPEQYIQPKTQDENAAVPGYDPHVSNQDQPNTGEAKTGGVVGGTPIRYEAGQDPMVKGLTDKLTELEKTYGDIQGKIEAYHPSKLRTALSTMAGIGTGMLTGNPAAGMAMGQHLQYEPRNRQLEPLEAKAHQQEAELKSMQDISGLGAKLGENQAAYIRAQGTYMRGDAAEKAEEDKAKNPTQHVSEITGPEGNQQIVTTPERGTGPSRVAYQGGTKPNEHAAKFDKSVSPDGTVSIIDKTTHTATQVMGADGKPLKEKSQEAQGFDTYWNSLPENERTPASALKWPQAGAQVNAGEKATERTTKTDQTTAAGTEASKIGMSVDKLKLGDNDKSYEAAMRGLDAAAAKYPQVAAIKGEIQKQLRAKYPKGSGKKKGFDPADIINNAAGQNTPAKK